MKLEKFQRLSRVEQSKVIGGSNDESIKLCNDNCRIGGNECPQSQTCGSWTCTLDGGSVTVTACFAA